MSMFLQFAFFGIRAASAQEVPTMSSNFGWATPTSRNQDYIEEPTQDDTWTGQEDTTLSSNFGWATPTSKNRYYEVINRKPLTTGRGHVHQHRVEGEGQRLHMDGLV